MANKFSRKENIRDKNESKQITASNLTPKKEFLIFSFKDFDETQPKDSPQTLQLWSNDGLLKPFFERLHELSKLTRQEAEQQKQIKIYGEFPPKNKTLFFHPQHVDANIKSWGVIKKVGGQKGVVAGYIIENTFYIVFLDHEHQFWISEKKNT